MEGSYTSLPFGDDYTPTGSDLDPYHYAQLDYDSESGTDHAQYRQYSSAQGRWMRPDPYYGSYNLSNPQTLNRCAYSLNNPLSFIDPSGLNCVWDDGTQDDDPNDGGDDSTTCAANGGTWNPSDGGAGAIYAGCTVSGGCTSTQDVTAIDPDSCNMSDPACQMAVQSFYNQQQMGTQAPSNAGHIAGCFAKGALVGAAGAVVAGGLAVGAVTLGAPVAAVTITLGLAGAAGAAATAYFTGSDIAQGTYASAAYGAGSLAGGLVAGGLNAANTVFGLTGEYGTPFSGFSNESSMNVYQNPGQSYGSALAAASAKGPTQAGAAGATGGLGSFLHFLRGGC